MGFQQTPKRTIIINGGSEWSSNTHQQKQKKTHKQTQTQQPTNKETLCTHRLKSKLIIPTFIVKAYPHQVHPQPQQPLSKPTSQHHQAHNPQKNRKPHWREKGMSGSWVLGFAPGFQLLGFRSGWLIGFSIWVFIVVANRPPQRHHPREGMSETKTIGRVWDRERNLSLRERDDWSETVKWWTKCVGLSIWCCFDTHLVSLQKSPLWSCSFEVFFFFYFFFIFWRRET